MTSRRLYLLIALSNLCLSRVCLSGGHVDSDKELLTEDAAHQAKQSAARLPLDAVKGPYRKRVLEIIKKPIVYRRSRVDLFPCQPLLYEWLVNHPLWVADYWRKMGLGVAEITTLEDGYQVSEGKRTSIRLHVVHDEPELRIIYCVGEARPALLPKTLRAEMVIVQHYRFVRRPNSRYLLAQQMEGFASARGRALKTVMNLAKPTMLRVVDQSLEETMIYFSLMCRLIQMQPDWSLEVLEEIRVRHPAGEADELHALLAQLPEPPSIPKDHSSILVRPSRPAVDGR